MSKLSSLEEDPVDRVSRLLPKSNDPTVVLLRGHLLVEEALFWVICSFCRQPRTFSEARLSFAQLVSLFKALAGLSSDERLCKFLKGLNEVRNYIAHHADVPDLNSKVDGLLASYAPEDFVGPTTVRKRASNLRTAFAFACGEIHGVGHGTLAVLRAQPTVQADGPASGGSAA